jgi:CheY-like chemotaxis protein
MSFEWKNHTILVVDDDLDMLVVLGELFQDEGAKVYSASNGQKALDVLSQHKVDFILSDIQMPVVDGVALLKQIRAQNKEIPIVLLATGQSNLTVDSAISLGAAGLIYKPFEGLGLLNTVKTLLTNQTHR